MEIKLKIKEFESYYISSDGYVFNMKTNKKRKHNKDKYGYFRIVLKENGLIKFFYIHRLIAEYFIYNPKNKPCVNHINGIKTDNSIQNLEWCTVSENNIHASKNGLLSKIHSRPSEIKKTDVLTIRELHKKGLSQYEISKKYNVCQSHISRLIRIDYEFI